MKTLTGVAALQKNYDINGSACTDTTGTLTTDTQVVVADQLGTTVATTTLEAGKTNDFMGTVLNCAMPFSVDVPHLDSYHIRIGPMKHPATWTFEELQKGGWHIVVNFQVT